jgi:hypothetical protein
MMHWSGETAALNCGGIKSNGRLRDSEPSCLVDDGHVPCFWEATPAMKINIIRGVSIKIVDAVNESNPPASR